MFKKAKFLEPLVGNQDVQKRLSDALCLEGGVKQLFGEILYSSASHNKTNFVWTIRLATRKWKTAYNSASRTKHKPFPDLGILSTTQSIKTLQ